MFANSEKLGSPQCSLCHNALVSSRFSLVFSENSSSGKGRFWPTINGCSFSLKDHSGLEVFGETLQTPQLQSIYLAGSLSHEAQI